MAAVILWWMSHKICRACVCNVNIAAQSSVHSTGCGPWVRLRVEALEFSRPPYTCRFWPTPSLPLWAALHLDYLFFPLPFPAQILTTQKKQIERISLVFELVPWRQRLFWDCLLFCVFLECSSRMPDLAGRRFLCVITQRQARRSREVDMLSCYRLMLWDALLQIP